jgi:hypothetical protein
VWTAGSEGDGTPFYQNGTPQNRACAVAGTDTRQPPPASPGLCWRKNTTGATTTIAPVVCSEERATYTPRDGCKRYRWRLIDVPTDQTAAFFQRRDQLAFYEALRIAVPVQWLEGI